MIIKEQALLEDVVGGSRSWPSTNYSVPETASAGDYGSITDLRDLRTILDSNSDIQVVSFDFMNTITSWTSSIAERHYAMNVAAVQVLEEHGVSISPDEYKEMRNEIWYEHKTMHREAGTDFKAADVLELIVDHILSGRTDVDVTSREIAEEIEHEIYRIEKDTAVVTRGTVEVLEELQVRGIKAVVYSNTPFSTEHVTATLEQLGIAQYFDRIIASSDFGYQKSATVAKGFGKLAWELKQEYGLDSARESILHVGDNPKEDYQGALHAGLLAVHYDDPESFFKQLKGRDINSGAYKRLAVASLATALDERVERMMDRTLDETIDSPKVRDFLGRLYRLGRDTLGPMLVHFADRRLKSLTDDPQKLAVCIGRDGLGTYEIMHKLLEENPDRYEGVSPEQIRYVTFSRAVIQKALQDGGFTHKVGYEQFDDKKLDLPEEGEDGYKGYKGLLQRYLEQEGFDNATEIRLIDSGLQGSTQTGIQALFPQWRETIEGRYLYAYQRCADPFKDYKDGYLLLFRTDSPERDAKPRVVRGDSFYQAQTQIYFFEDLGNGIDCSNCHLDEIVENGETRVVPRIERMRYQPDVDPRKIPEEFRHPTVYQAGKMLMIEGFVDAARLFSHAKKIDPSLRNKTFPSEDKAKRKLKEYLKGFRHHIKTGAAHLDADIFNTFIRHVGYQRRVERHRWLWEQEMRKLGLGDDRGDFVPDKEWKVSVYMPLALHNLKYFPEALDSILVQSLKTGVCIGIDDTVENAGEFFAMMDDRYSTFFDPENKEFGRIKYAFTGVANGSGGAAVASNVAMDIALDANQSRYVLHLDPDDLYYKRHAIASLLNFIEKDPACILAYADYNVISGDGKKIGREISSSFSRQKLWNPTKPYNQVGHPRIYDADVLRTLREHAGGKLFDEDLKVCVDLDLILRVDAVAATLSKKVKHYDGSSAGLIERLTGYPTVLASYRMHNAALSVQRGQEQYQTFKALIGKYTASV